MPKASIVISFYNKIDYLKLVLAGLERQSIKDFEVIISDDGSKPEIIEEINEIQKQSNLDLHHIWHEDSGFRKNIMLNKSIINTRSEYIIFIDGDCVPHSRFVEEHLNYAEIGTCLTGRRVNLSEQITKKLTVEKVTNGYLERINFLLFFDQLFGGSHHIERGYYIQSKFLRKLLNRNSRGILGCNFSIYKKDILLVNGFDERYLAPAIGEDTDIQFRLELMGIKIKPLINIANQYHLYHSLLQRTEANVKLFEQVVHDRIAFTEYGIEKKVPISQKISTNSDISS